MYVLVTRKQFVRINAASTQWLPVLVLLLTLGGCGGSAGSPTSATPAALSVKNFNLIFVVSEDIAFNGSRDIDPMSTTTTPSDGNARRQRQSVGGQLDL